MTGSDTYQKFTVLDEEIEVYLRITKVDEETGKPVLLPNTAFQIYWLDEQRHYRQDKREAQTGHDDRYRKRASDKNDDTFYTNEEGILTLPEKLPLGKYRIVETVGPDGFYNEWLGRHAATIMWILIFPRTAFTATGDDNENGMDTLVIGENYSNDETLGKLTIRKTGEVLLERWKPRLAHLTPG